MARSARALPRSTHSPMKRVLPWTVLSALTNRAPRPGGRARRRRRRRPAGRRPGRRRPARSPRSPSAPPPPQEAIRAMAARGDILVGAGTVLTADQVDQAVAAGARYVVSPGLSRGGRRALPRARRAWRSRARSPRPRSRPRSSSGLTTVKFFPAGTSGGATAITALAAPFGRSRLRAHRRRRAGQPAEYLALPSVAAVGGSWMVPARALRSPDRATSTRRSPPAEPPTPVAARREHTTQGARPCLT